MWSRVRATCWQAIAFVHFSVPEGRLIIAQRFIAGYMAHDIVASPGGTIEAISLPGKSCNASIVPPGLSRHELRRQASQQ